MKTDFFYQTRPLDAQISSAYFASKTTFEFLSPSEERVTSIRLDYVPPIPIAKGHAVINPIWRKPLQPSWNICPPEPSLIAANPSKQHKRTYRSPDESDSYYMRSVFIADGTFLIQQKKRNKYRIKVYFYRPTPPHQRSRRQLTQSTCWMNSTCISACSAWLGKRRKISSPWHFWRGDPFWFCATYVFHTLYKQLYNLVSC